MAKILVIDDEVDLREALATALQGAGFEVLTADNGESGVEIAIAEKPDLILMDINMPELSGHQVVDKLRIDPWGRTARVVYLTANSDPKNVVEAVGRGGEEYIVKSNTSLAEVVAKVKQVYHKYQ